MTPRDALLPIRRFRPIQNKTRANLGYYKRGNDPVLGNEAESSLETAGLEEAWSPEGVEEGGQDAGPGRDRRGIYVMEMSIS